MKLKTYLEEKIFFILFQITFAFLLSLFLSIFKVDLSIILLFDAVLIIYTFVYLIIDFHKVKTNYNQIINLTDGLEEKYYISEVLPKPDNLTNKAYYYALKEACKAMNDKISNLEKEKLDFEEYIESFVHDIKTPISALYLSIDNNPELLEELHKINSKVEQMLFYARSDSAEKDYFIKGITLEDLIHPVIMDYKNYLLSNKIKIITKNLNYKVYTDEKWLHFIISQIIQNSIKYLDKEDKQIEIVGEENKNNIILSIKDNGIGISPSDLYRVFEKGFTGSNRKKESSTGMGLYLAKKLSDKLGLSFEMSSKEKEYTKIIITFPKTNMHKMENS